MDRTERVVRVARRRMTASALIDGAGRGLAWGAMGALVLVGAGKLVAMPWAWWVAASVLIVVGGCVGALLALRGRGSMLDAAGEVDRRLRLKDRLSSGTALFSAPGVGGIGAFQTLAVEEADRVSGGVDPRRAVPLVWGGAWRVWPAIAAAAVGVGVWVPAMDLMGASRRREAEEAKAREAVGRKLAEAAILSTPERKPLVPTSQEEPRAESTVLQEIEKELASGKIDPSRAAERGARELEKIATERENATAAGEKAHEELRDTIAKMNTEAPKSGAGESGKLGDAIRSGDLGEAAQAAREMLNSSPEQSAEDRARAAAELDTLARDLREAEGARQEAQRSGEGKREGAEGTRQEGQEAGTKRPKGEEKPAQGDRSPSAEQPESTEGDRSNGREAGQQPSETEQLAKAMERAAEDLRDRPEKHPPRTDGREKAPADKKAAGAVDRSNPTEQNTPSQGGASKQPKSAAAEEKSEGGNTQEQKGTGTKESEAQSGDKKAPSDQGGDKTKPSENGTPPNKNAANREERRSPTSEKGEQSEKGSKGPDDQKKDTQAGKEGAATGDTKERGEQTGERKDAGNNGPEPSANKSMDAAGGENREKKPDGAGSSDSAKSESKSEAGKQGQPEAAKSEADQSARQDAKETGQTKTDSNGRKPATDMKPESGDKSAGDPQPSPTGDASKPESQPGDKGVSQKDQKSQKSQSAKQEQARESVQEQGQQKESSKEQPNGSPQERPGTQQPTGASPKGAQDGKPQAQPGTSAEQRSGEKGRQESGGPPQKPTDNEPSTPSDGQKGAAASEKKTPEESGTDANKQSEEKNTPSQQPGGGLKQLADRLEQLAKQPQNAGAARKQAEGLRKQAQEMLKNATPEQRKELERWAQQHAKKDGTPPGPRPGEAQSTKTDGKDDFPGRGADGADQANGKDGGPFGRGTSDKRREPGLQRDARTDTVDARPPTPNERREKSQERVIAEWYADKKRERGEPSSSSLTSDAERTVREAVKDGEHAVETEAVPSRYDKLLRKYFQRLGDRAKTGADVGGTSKPNAPSRPAEPARDAGAPAVAPGRASPAPTPPTKP